MRHLFVTLFFLFIGSSMFSQNIEIPISTDKFVSGNDTIYLHRVNVGEKIVELARRYNVPLEIIFRDNPQTKVSEILENDLIFIRKSPGLFFKDKREDNVFIPKGDKNNSVNISLILPIEGANSTSTEFNYFLDFYQGALMAIAELNEKGLSCNLRVFDINEWGGILKLVSSDKLSESNVIIGPVFSADLVKVLNYTTEKNISVVSPLDSRSESLTLEFSNFFQAVSSPRALQENLINQIDNDSKIVLITEIGSADRDLEIITNSILEQKGIQFSKFSYALIKDKSPLNQIALKLSKDKINHIVVPSNSEAFVYDLLRNLNLLSTINGYKIKIYGTPRWRNFEILDLSYFHEMGLTLSVQDYVDFSDERVKNFLFRYRAIFQSEPNAYAYRAYDLTILFADILASGINQDDIRLQTFDLLQSQFKFIVNPNGKGYINLGSRVIEYMPDYSIKRRTL